jgi:hypothetical protein
MGMGRGLDNDMTAKRQRNDSDERADIADNGVADIAPT